MWDECYNKRENTDEVKNMVLIESNFDAPTYRAFYRYDAFFKSSKALVLAIGEILLAALLIYCITAGYSQLVLVAVILLSPCRWYTSCRWRAPCANISRWPS